MTQPLNIMLLQCEDIGRHLGCYGDPYASTPNMDQLASEGARYTNAFSHAPVCAPSRGGMVIGCYPWTIGNHLMRCTLVNPPRMFTHELVDAGYHVSWPTKLDFNFEPTEGWCTDQEEWWSRKAPDMPFFVYRNFGLTHESRMFKEVPDWHGRDFPCPEEARHDPEQAPVPPYLPDTPELRRQIAAYHDAMSAIDQQIGQCLQWLDENGHREDTIVILLADHGRGLPREKRWCYDAGLHLPLIIRWPGKIGPGSVTDELVAWVDIAPTILTLAGLPVPDHYQGQVFLGEDRAPEREYVFAGRDRMDEVFDKQRVARDRKFHYVRNDAHWLPWAQKQWYMEQQPVMPVMRKLNAEGKLQGDEAVFFQPGKPEEELFDAEQDPDMLHNLAGDPAYSDTLKRLRAALDEVIAKYSDLGETDERDLIRQGIVTDKLAEYKERCARDELPADQIIGPRPIPTTLEEALSAK
ncbi:MAG: sulfatase family protein [Oceanipulchritudo sp.]